MRTLLLCGNCFIKQLGSKEVRQVNVPHYSATSIYLERNKIASNNNNIILDKNYFLGIFINGFSHHIIYWQLFIRK